MDPEPPNERWFLELIRKNLRYPQIINPSLFSHQLLQLLHWSDFFLSLQTRWKNMIHTVRHHLSRLFSINPQTLIQEIEQCKSEIQELVQSSLFQEASSLDLPSIPKRYDSEQLFNHEYYRSQHTDFIHNYFPLVEDILSSTIHNKENHSRFPLHELIQIHENHILLLEKTKKFRKTIIIYHQLVAINTLHEEFSTFSETEVTELKEKFCKKLWALHQYILTKGSELRHDTYPYFQNTHPHQWRWTNFRFKHTYSVQIDHTIIPYIAEQIAELKSLLTRLRKK